MRCTVVITPARAVGKTMLLWPLLPSPLQLRVLLVKVDSRISIAASLTHYLICKLNYIIIVYYHSYHKYSLKFFDVMSMFHFRLQNCGDVVFSEQVGKRNNRIS